MLVGTPPAVLAWIKLRKTSTMGMDTSLAVMSFEDDVLPLDSTAVVVSRRCSLLFSLRLF
jgi:hypothetical protein